MDYNQPVTIPRIVGIGEGANRIVVNIDQIEYISVAPDNWNESIIHFNSKRDIRVTENIQDFEKVLGKLTGQL